MNEKKAIDILNEINGDIYPTIIKKNYFLNLLEQFGELD